MRKLASIRRIDSIDPIDGADRIEKATVDDWTVVVGKGLHEVGDWIIFCEIDSAIPVDNPRLDPDGSLADRGVKIINGRRYHVLKTVKLRNTLSQGLILPLSALTLWQRISVFFAGPGVDVSKKLGIFKYDPFAKEQKSQFQTGARNPNIIGPFPHEFARKSDSERIQNLDKAWHKLRERDWVVTEKIDGQSVTLINDDGKIRVASRNYEVKAHPALEWAIDHEFEDNINPGYAVQGEWAGPGIQGNKLGLDKPRFFVFDVFHNGQTVPVQEWPWWAIDRRVPVVRIEAGGLLDIHEMIELYDGIKSKVVPGRLAEGVVFRDEDDEALRELGGRPNFKIISNKWLLKADK